MSWQKGRDVAEGVAFQLMLLRFEFALVPGIYYRIILVLFLLSLFPLHHFFHYCFFIYSPFLFSLINSFYYPQFLRFQ